MKLQMRRNDKAILKTLTSQGVTNTLNGSKSTTKILAERQRQDDTSGSSMLLLQSSQVSNGHPSLHTNSVSQFNQAENSGFDYKGDFVRLKGSFLEKSMQAASHNFPGSITSRFTQI